jgi:isochorismate pyruvate lyase
MLYVIQQVIFYSNTPYTYTYFYFICTLFISCKNSAVKKPEDCLSIGELRNEIDNIDQKVIELLGDRFQYVKEVVKFKKNEADVLARERFNQVIEQRRDWAKANGLNPDIIESIYRLLINYFIEVQKNILKIQ